jgi:hypothetical protein
MRILITVAMMIVFISAFFILVTGNAIFTNSFSCSADGSTTVCEFTGFSGPALVGTLIITFFIVIDAFSVYLVISNLK